MSYQRSILIEDDYDSDSIYSFSLMKKTGKLYICIYKSIDEIKIKL